MSAGTFSDVSDQLYIPLFQILSVDLDNKLFKSAYVHLNLIS